MWPFFIRLLAFFRLSARSSSVLGVFEVFVDEAVE